MFSLIQRQFRRHSIYDFVLAISQHLIAISESFLSCKQRRHAFDAIIIRVSELTFLHLMILKNQHYKRKDNCHVH